MIRITVTGPVGAGKTYLIELIVEMLRVDGNFGGVARTNGEWDKTIWGTDRPQQVIITEEPREL